MKKMLLFCLLFTLLVTAQDVNLFYNHKIPTFDYHVMNLAANDLLGYMSSQYTGQGKYETYNSRLSLNHGYHIQNPRITGSLSSSLSYNYSKQKSPDWRTDDYKTIESAETDFQVYGNFSRYFDNEKGVFLFGDGSAVCFNGNYTSTPGYSYQPDLTHLNVNFLLGGGYGRVIEVRSVAKAAIIADEMDVRLSADQLEQLADVIEKRENGYYSMTFKDDAEIKFIEELTALIDKPEQTAKIQQILNSSLYKTINRYYGWMVKAGLGMSMHQSNSMYIYYMDKDKELQFDSDFYTSFRYTLPISFNKQFETGISITKNLQDRLTRTASVGLNAAFSVEHNYHWSTNVNCNISRVFAFDSGNYSNFSAGVSTQYVFLNRAAVYANAAYEKREFSNYMSYEAPKYISSSMEYEGTNFNLGFKYFIF